MAQKKVKAGKRHRLEVYFRMGQRLRIGPLLITLLGLENSRQEISTRVP